jgi:small subunit ribosomal protein S20
VPNKRSAAKRVLQSERRRQRNVAAKSEIKTVIKKTRAAIEAGETEQARQLAALAESKLAVAAKKGILHINNARRRAGRLHSAVDKGAASE